MCKCIEETEGQLREKLASGELAELKPKNATDLRYLTAKNMALMWRTGRSQLNVPFEATWTLANGKTKDTTINMLASHCPFCGRPVGEETPDSEPSHSPSDQAVRRAEETV